MATYTTQNTTDRVTTADAHSQGIDGGLNLKTDPSRLAPPETTRADNAWYTEPGNVSQLPAFASTMPANTSHVYNLHARDLPPPSSNGDIMVHGEVRDAPGSTTNLFTSPVWSDANGTSINSVQPMPPFQLRTRVLSSQQNFTTLDCGRVNPMFMREEAPLTGVQRRYGLATYDGATLKITFGLSDGMTETTGTGNYTFSADYIECAGIQSSNQWVAAYVSGTLLSIATSDFAAAAPIYIVTPTNACQGVNVYTENAAGVQYNPLTVVQHSGRTYVAYINAPAGGPYSVKLYDVLSAQTYSLGLSSASVPAGPFSVTSPNSHTPSTSTTFLNVQFNGNVYVVARATDTSDGVIVGSAVLPANSAPGIGTQTYSVKPYENRLSTSAITIFDSQGGTGAGAQLGIVLFRHQSEQPATSFAAYQVVAIDTYSFKANATTATNAGTLTAVSSNIVRTPAGAALASKAFTAYPSEAGYAGLPGAKNAYCIIRSGGWEPALAYLGNTRSSSSSATFSQPTYFVIDHQARIVGRTLEMLAPGGNESDIVGWSNVQTGRNYYASFPLARSLGSPLITAPDAAPNDTSLLDIVCPAWALTNQQAGGEYKLGGNIYQAQAPTSVLYQPTGICLSLSSAVSSVPPVQAAAYSVFSGMLTAVHDGRGISEANFHFAAMNPAYITTTTTPTSPGKGPAGTYYFTYIWEYVDAQGHIHRSQPSLPATTVVNAGNFYNASTLTLPLPVTTKAALGGVLRIRLYRSTVDNTDGNFYLVKTVAVNPVNGLNYTINVTEDTFYDPVAYGTGGTNIYALTAQPRLYNSLNSTTLNRTYLSTPPPPFLWQVSAKGRAFGLAQVLGQHRLYYTSAANGQYPFEWNTLNYAPVPPELGDVRSLEAMDDKIVILGTRTNAVMNGDGPPPSSATGEPTINGGFSVIQPIPTPAGVVGTGSPVCVPGGVMFQGFGGIQSVGRDTSITPDGAQVDRLTGRQINNRGQVYGRAVTLPTLQSVVWANPAGPALVFNYLTKKWSIWPLLSNAACIAQRMDGSIAVALQPIVGRQYATIATPEVPGADFGVLGTTYAPLCRTMDTSPALVVETPWLLPSGESAGEGQVWEVAITGTYEGPHILQVEQARNYGTAYTVSRTFTVDTAPPRYQFRVRSSAGTRLSSIRYRISLLPISTLSSGYAMAALSDLVLFSGVQQGTTRLGATTSG